ncbi:MAG: ankyrin repeat domain-containing protein [Calditrichaeota bacterium]|nr:MAG: ankyrin repeat domain-containing protein [Calditrichota bacterium]
MQTQEMFGQIFDYKSNLSIGMVDLLVQSGAEIKLKDSNGLTALDWAKINENAKTVKTLEGK